MRSLWWLVLLPACGSAHNRLSDDAAEVDARVPAVDASPCLGGGLVQLCLDTLPRDGFTVDGAKQIDTDRDSRCASFTPANPDWCVIAATRITIAANATLSAVGNRRLVLAATEAVQVDGTIDVASHAVNSALRTRGAGAGGPGCGPTRGATYPGGGPGGSFRTRGGDGGNGRPPLDSAGTAGAVVTVTMLRGGCNGGDGGFADPNPGGQGGDGGGAVYLLAPAIAVSATGVINASGGGGTPALYDAEAGAGGGGSGGMIGLDAPVIQLAAGARLFANGGGGGEGTGCAGSSTAAARGQDPRSPTVPAPGGRGEPNGGDGGDGALATTAGGAAGNGLGPCGTSPVARAGGGGGGGGGVGAVVLRGAITDTGAQISPPAVAMP